MFECDITLVSFFIRVNSFVEALINMICELKITSGSEKKTCKNCIVIRHSVKELLLISKKQCYGADEIHAVNYLDQY